MIATTNQQSNPFVFPMAVGPIKIMDPLIEFLSEPQIIRSGSSVSPLRFKPAREIRLKVLHLSEALIVPWVNKTTLP